MPRLAVTATADARTREDIRAELRLEDAREFVDSFARPELALSAERKRGQGHGRVLELVAERPKRSGVIYAGSRDGVDKLAEKLVAAGVPALAYHAGLDKHLRAARLEQFLEADAAVMVATIAFGMGVDKPDVRYVIHADPPAAIEAYWQEIGRAGRDGAPAEGITLYSASDLAWAMRRIDSRDVDDTVKSVQMRKVRQLYAMLDGAGCRPAAVRRYFGETGVQSCGVCDLCLTPPEATDVTEAAQKALSAVHRLGGRFGRGRVVDHLLGKTKDAVRLRDRRCRPAASAASSAPPAGATCSTSCCSRACCARTPTTAARWSGWATPTTSRAVYRGERRVSVRKMPASEARTANGRSRPRAQAPRRRRARPSMRPTLPLFEALRAWRRERAAEQHVPPYVIFHDATLADIARQPPGELGRAEGRQRRRPEQAAALRRRRARPGAPALTRLPGDLFVRGPLRTLDERWAFELVRCSQTLAPSLME